MKLPRHLELSLVIAMFALFGVLAVHQLWCAVHATWLRPLNLAVEFLGFYGIMGAGLLVMSQYRRVTFLRASLFLLAVTFVLANSVAMRVPAVWRRISLSGLVIWFVLYMALQFFVGLVMLPRLLPQKPQAEQQAEGGDCDDGTGDESECSGD